MNGNSALVIRRIDMNGASVRSLRDVIAVLRDQQKAVIAQGASFAGHLIGLAIMELRMTMNNISEEELSGLCDHFASDPPGSDPVD
jgi:hypothetical protein